MKIHPIERAVNFQGLFVCLTMGKAGNTDALAEGKSLSLSKAHLLMIGMAGVN